jgi:hypothetical protein
LSNSFVYIVESPSGDDLYDGRTEGRALCESLVLAGHAHTYTLASDRVRLERALSTSSFDDRLLTEWRRHSAPPVIHISAHGNIDGIALSSGELISWHDLREMMSPINDKMSDGLLVCFSTCSGYASVRMSMYLEDNIRPFWAIVGSGGNVSWGDALVGFTSFYHHWFQNKNVADCVSAMRAASGHSDFFFQSGQESKEGFRRYVASQSILGTAIPA